MQFGHKVAHSALPTHNRIYCTEARKQKFQFATKEAAEAFIAYCADTIMAQNGFAPVRSYWCKACKCYHVSSQQKSKFESRAYNKDVYNNEPRSKEKTRASHRTLNRLEKFLVKTFKALANHRMEDAKRICDLCLDLYEKCLKLAGAQSRRERLWNKLNLCVTRIADEEARMQRELLRIEYHPQTTLTHQWYMTKSAV